VRIIAEVLNWQGHVPEQIRQMNEGLAKLNASGSNVIFD
jgi:hypothetical protein